MFNGNMATWGSDPFGAHAPEVIEALQKALQAGNSINPPGSYTPGDGFALRTESLERTLRITQHRMEHIVFWRMLEKLKASNTVEEYNVLTQYGDRGIGGFISEGQLPSYRDAVYERRFAKIKFMGITRQVTHVATLTSNAIGNVISQETVNGTMDLLELVETALFEGDEALSPLQFDGLRKQIETFNGGSNVIDMRGKPMTQEVLHNAALRVKDRPNFGRPTNLLVAPSTKTDLSKALFPAGRFNIPQVQGETIGFDFSKYRSPAGVFSVDEDVFITDGGKVPTSAVGDAAQRPAAPTASTGIAAGAGAGSLFAAEDAGDYFYHVVAVNRHGKSAPLAANSGSALAVAAGQVVTVTIADPASGGDVDYYELYRSTKGGASADAALISRTPKGTTTTVLTDKNEKLPGTTDGYLIQGNTENLAVKQLAPMMKVPLSIVDLTIRWAQVMYFTLVLYQPQKNILFKNIGRSADV